MGGRIRKRSRNSKDRLDENADENGKYFCQDKRLIHYYCRRFGNEREKRRNGDKIEPLLGENGPNSGKGRFRNTQRQNERRSDFHFWRGQGQGRPRTTN